MDFPSRDPYCRLLFSLHAERNCLLLFYLHDGPTGTVVPLSV